MKNISNYILDQIPKAPRVAVVLGSGLSQFTDNLSNKIIIPYSDIPDYPLPTVTGHVGEFVWGLINSTPVICARGRFHYYEGHPLTTVTLPMEIFKALGCTVVIITNAAGSLRKEWAPGKLMLITGHLDFTFRNGSQDPQLISGNEYHDGTLIFLANSAAEELKIDLQQGNYCWTTGPSYETPTEINDFKRLSGDAVGMSTVPEIQKAKELGLRVLGISCLTNYAAGITDQPLSHREVLETTERVKHTFADLLLEVIMKL